MSVERIVILAAVAVLASCAAWWWQRRDGRVVEAHGLFDANDLGVPKRPRASATIVEFSGEHCASCVVVKDRLDALAEELGDVRVVAIDAGARLDLADRYHVRRVPTVFIADDRLRIRWRVSGIPTDTDLRAALLGPEWAGRPHPNEAAVDAR